MDTDRQKLFQSPKDPDALRIIPMGGCGEFGMNLTAYIFRGQLFVIDCGLRFPDLVKLGVDAVVPNVDEWFAAIGGVQAYIITHGHEDHIGALPAIIAKWPAPIYATAWTAELIKNKFVKRGYDQEQYKITIVGPGDRIKSEDIEFEYVHVNHSIPMACALFIRMPQLTIFHTGDFKFDESPIIEPATDFAALKRLGDEGVDVLLADSTNAEQKGLCPSESTVAAPLYEICEKAPGAIFFTTFSSNLWRLKTAIDVFQKLGRKIFIAGRGIETTLTVAKATGLYHVPENVLVAESKLDQIPRQRLAVIATGCQGEQRSTMAHLAMESRKNLKIHPDDTVIFSSRIIPGNEKAVLSLSDRLKKLGAHVITAKNNPAIHVSGHAYGGDLARLITLLRPVHFMPVHGAFSQLKSNLEGAKAQDTTSGDVLLIETGDVIDVRREGLVRCGTIEVALDYIDSESHVVLSHTTLRERLRIGELGVVLLSGVYSLATNHWLKKPEIQLCGLQLPPTVNVGRWTQGASHMLIERLQDQLGDGLQTETEINETARIILRRHLAQVLNKKPVVIVQLHLV